MDRCQCGVAKEWKKVTIWRRQPLAHIHNMEGGSRRLVLSYNNTNIGIETSSIAMQLEKGLGNYNQLWQIQKVLRPQKKRRVASNASTAREAHERWRASRRRVGSIWKEHEEETMVVDAIVDHPVDLVDPIETER